MNSISINKTLWILAFATGMVFTKSVSGDTGSKSASETPSENQHVATPDRQEEKERIFNFTSVNKQNLSLRIANAYGRVELKNWDKKEIKVQVRVIAKNTRSRNANEILDRVGINRTEDENGTSFETKINRGDWKDLIFDGMSSVTIHYEVYLPESTPISISNSYGKIILSNRSGKVQIRLTYGDLEAKSLKNKENEIQVSYSKINIEKMHKATLNASYSKIAVQQADEIRAILTYSTGASFQQISTSLTGTFTYSSGLRVHLGEKIENVKITSTYSNISLIPHNRAKFDFNIQTTYGQIKLGKLKTGLQHEVERGPTKHYRGYWNQPTPSQRVHVTATYGNVDFLNPQL